MWRRITFLLSESFYRTSTNKREIIAETFKKMYVIIKTFVRQRIFIKINFLNVEVQQQKINYGKKKRADRQASNKFKKITM
jgi:hypothetical protein